MEEWNIEIALMVMIDLTSLLQAKPVIEHWLSEKKSRVWSSDVIDAGRNLQNSEEESGYDTERNLNSDRSNAPILGGTLKSVENQKGLSVIKSSKLIRFRSITPEPTDLRTDFKFKKTNIEPSGQRITPGAFEIQEQYRSEPNLIEPNLSVRSPSVRSPSQLNLNETFVPTSLRMELKDDLSIIKETIADDEDLITQKNL